MLGKIAVLLLFLFLLFIGTSAAYEGWKNREAEPTRTTVADYVKSDKSKKWVVLTDAKINLLKAVTVTTTTTTTNEKTHKLVSSKTALSKLYIPIESAGSTQKDTVNLLLETDDKEILDVASQLMAKSEAELLQFIVREKDELIRSVELSGLMEKGGEEEIRKRIKNLAGDFYILKHNRLKPDFMPNLMLAGLIIMGIGLLLLTGFIFSLRRKKDDSQVQPATSPIPHSPSITIPPKMDDVVLKQKSVPPPDGDKSQVSPYQPPSVSLTDAELINQVSKQVVEEVVDKYIHEIHQGSCPQCHGPGPVDVHTSYRVYSLLLFTRWSSRPQLCCQSCGTKRKKEDMLFSLVCGWWGIPFGLIITPIQIIRNVVGLLTLPDPLRPSEQLKTMIKQHFGGQ